MIVCTHCQAKNSLDSLFCKSCGREVTEAEREGAREANAKLIAEGYSLLAEGRTEEAELVARAALEADVKAAGAYSLMGMCLERRDDIVAALECYEKVVELKPDSALDKIKVTQLRNVLARRSEEPVLPNRRNAMIGAIAAVLFVGAVGAAIAVVTRGPDTVTTKEVPGQKVASNGPEVKGFDKLPDKVLDYSQVQGDPTQTPPNGQPNVNPVTGSNNGGNNPNAGFTPDRGARRDPINTLPDPTKSTSEDPGVEDGGNRPVNLTVNPQTLANQGPTTQGTGNTSTGDDPTPDRGPNTTTNPGQKDKGTGTISITEHPGNPKSNNGGGSFIDNNQKEDPDGNGLKAVVRSANDQMLTGRYDGAAHSYERAIQMGGDRGKISQKLGMCYEKMGKKGDAITAYRAAKKHLEATAGSDPKAKSQLEAVNQALKNLGG